jgi:hypothetical protein
MFLGSVVKRTIERIATDDELEKVNLKGKRIDDDEFAQLSSVLSYNASITTLQLSNNNIGHEGIAALADALHQNLHIEHIDISSNNIGNKGAAALADCLQHNTSVISLNLQNNGIEDEGAEALLSVLSTNSTVHSINLKDNAIHESLLAKIDEALGRSKAMFEAEVVYFASSPAKKDQDLAAVDTFSMTLSEDSKGGYYSFDSSTDDICVATSNNYIFQGAPLNAESSSTLNAEGIAADWVNMFGSFFHNDDEKNKDSIEMRVIPVSDDKGYNEFLAFLKNESASHTTEEQDPIVSENNHQAQQSSEEKDVRAVSPQKNPLEVTFNWIGSLFQNDEEKVDNAKAEKKNDTSDEEKRVPRIIPASDDEGYHEFIAFLQS